MSTLKTTNLQNASAASPAIVLAADGSATANLSSVNGGAIAGSRNRIINGDMRIDQRNAGASVTPALGAFVYTVDRWNAYVSQNSKCTIQQNAGSVTPPVGFTNYLGVTSSSAYSIGSTDLFFLNQAVEGFNTADLAWGTADAKTVALSFWVRSSLAGTFGGALLNNAADRSYPFSYSIPTANTWTQISVTIAGDTTGTWLTTNGLGIRVAFGFGVGSTYSATAGSWAAGQYWSATGATSVVGTSGATFYITGVQLEPGSTATPFERRSYGQELALCQRYTHAATADGALNTFMVFGIGRWFGGSDAQIAIQHPVEMRTAPTLASNTAVGTFFINTGGGLSGVALTGIGLNEAGINVSTVSANYSTGGQTTGQATTLYCNNTSFAKLVFSAEL